MSTVALSPGPRTRPDLRAPVRADGRHLQVAGDPWRLRGVTYGSFLPRADGEPFPEPVVVRADLARAADAGFNTVRTYCLPPADLLDAAEALGLRLLVGLHYDDWRVVPGGPRSASRAVRDAGRRAVDDALERLAGRPGIAAVLVGNEVPADLVRLTGVRRVEAVLSDLVGRLHEGAPELLAGYATYPTTEYLEVEGRDLACVNVFLDDPAALARYLRHLAVNGGELPLVVSELGVDARRVGPQGQAALLRAQLEVVDEVGCAGAAVFALTDEWGVGGHPVRGWSFGLHDEDRAPRPALAAVGTWARRPLRDLRAAWPALTVVVCAYNEQERLGRCLDSLAAVDYPDLEVLVCDDGSTDGTVEVARRYPFRLLQLPHGGLSAARNAGTAAARGELVAFLDADAACHPEWPYHLALSLADARVVGTGGPNLAPEWAGPTARAVDLAPGNPVEVLTGPDRSEHVPGCNSAFRRSALLAVGGFLPALTTAGDDVDLCWRLLDAGGQLAFSPAAQVRHERRSTVRSYLRQQRGYGRAERLVSGRHPHRFNTWGQATWSASVYGGPLAVSRLLPRVVRHGPAGSAAYQPVQARRGSRLLQYAGLLVLPLLVLGLLSAAVAPVLPAALPVALADLALLLGYAGVVAAGPPRARRESRPVRALAALLHLLQPVARCWGAARTTPLPPLPRQVHWTGDRLRWLDALHVALAERRLVVRRGGVHDAHDLLVQAGPLLRCRVTTAVRWGAQPLLAARLRPGRPALVLAVAAGVLLALRPPLGLVVAAVLAAGGAAEARLLRARLAGATRATTAPPVPAQRVSS